MNPRTGTRLQGKTALVTGSTRNIGSAIAVALAAEGAFVIVSGRDTARGAEVVDTITGAGGHAAFVPADLDGSPEASRRLAADALTAAGGRLDILVNNAGIYPAVSTVDTDEAAFDRMYAINVKAPYFLTAAVVPSMIESGGGVVINLGSWIARLAVPVGALYASTKGAMETLTRAWSAEFGPHGIRVNAISPGVIRPEEHAADGDFPGAALMNGTPAAAAGNASGIGAAAVYLASDNSVFVHGTVLDVDGGRTAVAVVA
ncbi:SDR family oxidoreductase [Microlunatus elymi]|uniref:SDR family oxidoreductase n=1 Tax=Microlunatus elymi TaxID=2596828 RepID=A0A516PTW8_9ACTN|nr:SDR family oxidoreductase [Microlunatus elymi]QDP94628.1 SDR family oxidoreductase [Microlunatus elymi]